MDERTLWSRRRGAYLVVLAAFWLALSPRAAAAQPADDPLLADLEESLRQAEWMIAQAVAATLCDVGQLEECVSEYESALAMCERAKPPELPRVRIEIRLAVARAELGRGRHDAARANYQAALDAIAGERTPPRDARMQAELGLAHVLLELGETDAARTRYERVVADLTAAGRGRDALAADIGLVAVALTAGEQPRADELLGRVSPAARGTAYEPYALRLAAIADVAARRYEPATAKLRALDEHGMKRLRDHFRQFADESFHLSSVRQQQADTELAVSLALAAKTPEATRFALEVVLRRKGLVLDVEAARRRALASSGSPEITSILARQAEVRAELGALTRQHRSQERDAQIAKLADARRALGLRLQLRIDMLSEESADAAARFQPRALAEHVPIDTLQKRLASQGGGASLVEIIRSRRRLGSGWQAAHYVAFVLPPRGEPRVVDLGAAEPIDVLVQSVRASIARGKDAKSGLGALHESLLAPLRAAAGGAGTLWLAPDGLLHLLPFDALLTRDGRYAIEELELRYVTSGRDLLQRAAPPLAHKPAATILADPAFAEAPKRTGVARRRMVFPALPGTATEAKRIARLLPRATVRRGKEASRAALVGVKAPPVLHIATHGFFLPEAPAARSGSRGLTLEADASALPAADDPLLHAGLALAGANASDEGIVTASEMAMLALDGTRLAVLSACETGLGELRGGEGVFGLRRALVIAGSETQVLSLWAVDDAATATLMTRFYEQLIAGTSRHQALRHARLSLLREAATAHPMYWASFVVSGLDGPLVTASAAPPHPGRLPAKSSSAACGCRLPGASTHSAGARWLVMLSIAAASVVARRARGRTVARA
jgi:CHAT domain-containing protein